MNVCNCILLSIIENIILITNETNYYPPLDEASDEKKNSSSTSIQANALLKAKGKLKPTETVEKHLPVVGTSSSGGRQSGHNIKDEEHKKEYFDKEDVLEKKVKKAAEWVKKSKHVIFFTGAGISTRYIYSILMHIDPSYLLSILTVLVYLTSGVEWVQYYPRDLVFGSYKTKECLVIILIFYQY